MRTEPKITFFSRFKLVCFVSVRLVGGGQYYGRVEIFYNGRWGTVCDKRWDIREGNVVCRQLGLVKALEVYKGARFGIGNGTIWLMKLGCKGNESTLLNCSNAKANLGKTDCTHQEDAGVLCDQTPIGRFYHFLCTNAENLKFNGFRAGSLFLAPFFSPLTNRGSAVRILQRITQ